MTFFKKLTQFQTEVDAQYEELLRKTHLNGVVQLYVLNELFPKDGQRASDLARAVGRAATSFTPTLDSLEALGLIERHPSAEDRRVVTIHLTSKGCRLLWLVPEIALIEARMVERAEALFSNSI